MASVCLCLPCCEHMVTPRPVQIWQVLGVTVEFERYDPAQRRSVRALPWCRPRRPDRDVTALTSNYMVSSRNSRLGGRFALSPMSDDKSVAGQWQGATR